MSFDLSMFEVRAGESVDAARERITEPAPATPERERLRRETVAALLEHDPALDVFESEEGAPLTELTSLDDSKPAQVTLYGDQAFITIPYWHSGEEAKTTMAAVWRLVEIIHERTGWILYDEQEGRQVDIAAGPEQLVGGYEYGTAAVADIAARETGGEPPPAEPEPQPPPPEPEPRRRRRRFWPF
jgi:hypothetical protein